MHTVNSKHLIKLDTPTLKTSNHALTMHNHQLIRFIGSIGVREIRVNEIRVRDFRVKAN